MDTGEYLYSPRAVERIVGDIAGHVQMARMVYQQYAAGEVFVVVLNGAFMFAADLLRRLPPVDSVDFVHVSSYESEVGGSVITWKMPTVSLRDKTVYLVEDIVDRGATAVRLASSCRELGARRLVMVALLDRPQNRVTGPGVGVERLYDRWIAGSVVQTLDFLVGYGLDLDNGRFRDRPYIDSARQEEQRDQERKASYGHP